MVSKYCTMNCNVILVYYTVWLTGSLSFNQVYFWYKNLLCISSRAHNSINSSKPSKLFSTSDIEAPFFELLTSIGKWSKYLPFLCSRSPKSGISDQNAHEYAFYIFCENGRYQTAGHYLNFHWPASTNMILSKCTQYSFNNE